LQPDMQPNLATLKDRTDRYSELLAAVLALKGAKMAKRRFLHVTKLDAAKRQVEQALALFFSDGDPVAIHTLLFASVEIIDGLYKRKTKKRLFFGNAAMVESGVTPTVKHWGAFFKHGREWELDRTLAFNPDSNLVLFSACIEGLDGLGEERSELAIALSLWLGVHHPDMVSAESLPIGKDRRALRGISKKHFLESFRYSARRDRARTRARARRAQLAQG
jgi:hypothetical protein